MSRRYITAFIAAAILAVLTVNASDFWAAKDWHQWSKDECAKILVESPWAHVWRSPLQTSGAARSAIAKKNGNPPPLVNSQTQTPPVSAEQPEDGYAIQLRSALPIREAIVRQLEIVQEYDRKSGAQRKAFDDAAGQILNTNYANTILVRLYLSKDAPGLGPHQVESLQATLVTEDGKQISPAKVDADPMTPYAIDLYFPRVADGVPSIKAGQKQFSIHFLTPQYTDTKGVNVLPRRAVVNFDLTKMLVDGKPNY